jgi:hypothetical protein
MMKIKNIIFAIAISVIVSGCAAPARVLNMTVASTSAAAEIENSVFRNNLSVVKVYGGNKTNPLWISQVSGDAFETALRYSLEDNGLSSQNNPEPRFEITANLSELEQPAFGIDITVKSKVGYEVVETKTGEAWFSKTILASYTATFSDAIIGAERLKLANEGSIRENIRKFIIELLQSP